MTAHLRPAFSYVIAYVKDVERSVAFYERAFGLSTRMRAGITRTAWGEMETGATTLAFTPVDQVKSGSVMLPGYTSRLCCPVWRNADCCKFHLTRKGKHITFFSLV
jgi:catechol 2,3-dioxygenase-like lactoylglutathione lyase family enzyme